ncbi:MAG TPA: Ig-like domain-containing protein [Gallionella sp.]|nr:Ig-like domain-containing protein [Gallionella sp.]
MKNSMPVNATKQPRGFKENRMPFPAKLKVIMAAVMLTTTALPAHAVLERVGPTSTAPSIGGFPTWYQDTSGLTLEFCDPKNPLEVAGGWCLLLPANVPTVPEVFPTSFFNEHFYHAANALMTAANGGKAVLVLALEGAFATGPAIPGDQITFARIRARLTNVPVSGTYRVIHPYGEELITAVAGGRIFYTQDVGIGAPGDFSGALTSRLGPFLLPAATPGGVELPAVAGPAGLYIADPIRVGPVTGSTLPDFTDSTGVLRNHNIFRIEGPAGSNLGGQGIDFIETTGFSLMGRVFTGTLPGRIDVKRASYTRDATGQKVDVFATAFGTIQARLPATLPPAPVVPQLSFYDAPCAGTADPVTGAILPPYSAPTGAVQTTMLSDGSDFWGQAQPAVLPAEVCVLDSAARDALGNPVPVFAPKQVTDAVTITAANYDKVAQALSVAAVSSDTSVPPTLTLAFGTRLVDLVAGQASVAPLAAPPSRITVRSSALGTNDFQVSTGAPVAAAPGTAPVIGSTPVLAATDGQAYSYSVTATDVNGGPLTFTLDQAPAGMTISAAGTLGAAVAWTPTAAQVGTQTVTVRATDPTGLFTTQTYNITVAAAAVPGTAPVFGSTPVLTATDAQAYSYSVTATDVDGGPLTFTLDQAPAGMTIVAAGAFGAAIAWTPTTAQVGAQAVTVRATDPTGLFTTQSWSINVAPVTANNPPVAANDSYTMIQGTTLNVTAPGVLANDRDPNVGDTLTATNFNPPAAGGTLAGRPDGGFSYTPPPTFTGLTRFSYLARDNRGMPSTAAGFVQLAVRVNRAPVAVADAFSTPVNTPLVINVLGNDSDPDTVIDPSNKINPATVFIPVGKQPNRGGTVTVNADGTINYTPAAGFVGIESFQYAVRDTYITPAISRATTVQVTVQ